MPPQLGPYQRVRELDRGAMGAVYEVVHVSTGARYALKTILPHLLDDDSEMGQRFRREAQLLAQLDHPHVVAVHSADFSGPIPYLVQDLVSGGTLAQRMRKGPLPIAEALEVLLKVTAGIAHAHERGVLHRDLKPANVLFDAHGQPRVVDFGLALSTEERERLTQTGTILGSPAYMPPEQALATKECDERSDVYALAALGYALFTGHPPFDGDFNLAVLEQVISEPPAPPRSLRPDLPRAIEAVLLRALAKDPNERPSSARELAEELRAAAAEAPGDSSLRVLLALAVLSLLLATLALGWAASRRAAAAATPSPSVAESPSPRPSRRATPSPTASPLAWRWQPPAGTSRHLLHWTCEESDDTKQTFHNMLSLALRLEPQAPGRFKGVVEAVRCNMDGKVRYDSTTGEWAGFGKLLPALVDAEFDLQLDLRQGAAKVSGLPNLRAQTKDLIFPGVAIRLCNLFTDPVISDMLSACWGVFPPEGAPAQEWERSGHVWLDPFLAVISTRRYTWGRQLVGRLERGGKVHAPYLTSPPRVPVVEGEHTLEVERGWPRRSGWKIQHTRTHELGNTGHVTTLELRLLGPDEAPW
ncbi:MAG TPA: hypothetical protein DEA08_03550 [Planctomycetes bacterium]|nr:hypothetical protein [Planctomycetota bacterium]